MLKLIDVFIIGVTNSFSFFPAKIADYGDTVAEIQQQLDCGMQMDAKHLTEDKSNIYRDLSKAFNQLTNEPETAKTTK